MHALPIRRTVAIVAAATLLVAFRSLAGAAALESITVEPPVVQMRPCEVVLLEITGHYDDGTARDLELEFDLTFTFAEGNAQRSGTRTVVNNVALDDVLTVSLDGVDSAPVPLLVVTPEDRSLCPVIVTTTTTTTAPPSTSSSTTTSTTVTTSTLDPSTPTTTSTSSTTTTTLPPEPEDSACQFCAHDRVQHRFRIENHLIFHREQVLQDRCMATEFPNPIFQVAADGTQSSVFDLTQVIEGSCQTTLTDPNPRLLDESFQPLANPDPDFHGTVVPIDRRADFVRFNYTHPTTPPPDGDKFRVVRIGIFYIDRRNPGAGERLVRVVQIRVYRALVLMVHGLWGDAGAFADMERTLASSNYEPSQLYRLDYRNTNDSSFTTNYPLVSGGLDAVIQQGADANLAAGKVDVVTHSMGGVLSRLYIQDPGYAHEVRRIVTCNTPHAGSQMANLLLDRTFDPQGLICSLLSRAMSSSSVPNRGCNNGAVDDMRVSSAATTNFLNLGTHPSEVSVHALATVFDLAALPNLSGLALPAGTAPFIIANVLRACSLSLVDNIFNFDDSDLIVSATSQSGGLNGALTSLFPDQAHVGSTANADVIDRVRELLNEPNGSSSFTDGGYTPGRLGYTTPSACPLLRCARTLGASPSAATTGITIESPAPGTTFAPGESFVVDVAGGTDVATVVLVVSQPGGATVIEDQPGPDATFDIAVPGTAVGSQNVVAAGLDAAGNLVAVSDTLNVEVRVPSALSSITVYPPAVYLRPCTAASLEITGHYEDGVARDLSAQPGLVLAFGTGNAARNGASGVILNEPSGDTLIVTFDGVDSAPVPIRALVPDDLGSCGATTTTTTAPEPSTTTTTTPETSTTVSTTTPPTTSTTTSTLPAVCQAATDCDDGDACTDDTCAPSGCEHVVLAGLGGAECQLAAALAGPLCAAGTIDPDLERFATGKLERALALVRQAAATTKPKRERRLIAKASKAVGRITRHKPGTTTDECLQRLAAWVDELLSTLGAAASTPA